MRQEKIPKIHKDYPGVGNLPFEESPAVLEEKRKIALQYKINPEDLIYKKGEHWFDAQGNKYRDTSFDNLEFDDDSNYRFGHH